MVPQSKDELMYTWHEKPQHPTAMTHVTLFILLAVRQVNHLIDLSPVVEAKAFWAPDFDGAQQQAQTMLQQDGRIDHVSILDGQGHGVLGVANRPPSATWPPSAPLAAPVSSRSRVAFH